MNRSFEIILKGERPASAYLIAGADGDEKEAETLLLCRSLLASHTEKCPDCDSCRRFTNNSHPDFIDLKPEKNSITIEQVRESSNRISFRPVIGSRYVLLIREAEKMTIAAANALLKSLEEPPPYVIYLLSTSTPERLLATIRSRCQIVCLDSKQDPSQWKALLEFWNKHLLPQLGKKSLSSASNLAELFLKEVESLPDFFRFLRAWYRDLIVYQETRDTLKLKFFKPDQLRHHPPSSRYFEQLEEILITEKAIEGNVLKQLAVERLFLRLMT